MVHPVRRRAALRRLSTRPSPRSVLVVCHGNICRSPYAAALLGRLLGPSVPHAVQVSSAGFIQPGRPCPAVVMAVAAARGVDLSGHRSRLVASPDVHGADLIVVMNEDQRWGVRALFGVDGDAILVLGDLDPETIQAREILDPIERPREVVELSYSRIDRCVAELVRAVSQTAPRAADHGDASHSQRDENGEPGRRQEQTT